MSAHTDLQRSWAECKLSAMLAFQSPSQFATAILSVFLLLLTTAVPVGNAQSCYTPVGHWKFDDGSGTSAVDSSGNANTGTLNNGPTWSNDVPSVSFTNTNSLSFDGSDDYVLVSNSPSVDIDDDTLTFTAWIKGAGTQIIARSVDTSSPSGRVYGFYTASWLGDVLGLEVRTVDGYADLTSSVGISTNTWTHVAGVYDGTSLKLYINGTLDANTAAITGNIYDQQVDVHIGVFQPGVSPFSGLIDDLRLYEEALTSTEVGNVMTYGSSCGAAPVPEFSEWVMLLFTIAAGIIAFSYRDRLGLLVRPY